MPVEAPNAVKTLLKGLEIDPPLPSIVDAGTPLELKLTQGASITDALSTVKAIGSYTLDLASVTLPGLALDQLRNAFVVDLKRIDLGNNLNLSLGQVELENVEVSTAFELAAKSGLSHHSPFSSVLSSPASISDTSVTIAAAPSPGQTLSLDERENAETRTVISVSGQGPFSVALDAPLARSHSEGSRVTEARAFVSVLSAAATSGATEVSLTAAPLPGPAAPQPGQILEIDTAPSAETRTVRALEGTGPYRVRLSEPLASSHLVGAKVTQLPILTASRVPTDEPVVPIASERSLQLGSRLRGFVGSVKGSIGKAGVAAALVQKLPGSLTGFINDIPKAAEIRLPALRQLQSTKTLSVASTAGATSITTVERLRPGMVEIDKGTIAETRAVSKVSGPGPYTATLAGPPLMYGHNRGAEVTQLRPLGQIKLSLSEDPVLPDAPTITAKWSVQTPDTEQHFVVLTNALEGNLATPPTILFFPQFKALGQESASQYSIKCTVKAVGTDPVSGQDYESSVTLGPVSVKVPQIGIPTVAIMTEHPRGYAGYPGAVLVAVPDDYPSIDWRSLLAPLQKVQQVISLLLPLLPPPTVAPNLPDFAALSTVLTELVGVLNVQPFPQTIIRRNAVLDLFKETSAPGWPHNWNDKISSVIIVGPPNSGGVVYHNRFNLWYETGKFRVQLGPLPAAMLSSLDFGSQVESDKLAAIPPGTKVIVEQNSDVGTFNDVISSYQFFVGS